MELEANQLVIQLEDSLQLGGVIAGVLLIGVLMADKAPNHRAVKRILRKSWEQFGEAKINIVKENLLAITVENEYMAIKLLSVCKLPLEKMTEDNARCIGASIATILEVDAPDQEDGYRGFLRFIVLFDTQKPLVEGFWLPRPHKPMIWAEIRYERLVDYCYHCGRLGHIMDSCPFPDGDFGLFTTDLRAKVIRPPYRRQTETGSSLGTLGLGGALGRRHILSRDWGHVGHQDKPLDDNKGHYVPNLDGIPSDLPDLYLGCQTPMRVGNS
ncbi:uncharacterized protein Pyn_29889 [Prunus yedoensis var. nudiflora]|uniref:CCHC-type domain-containing protein n=1 Tax=Prunus yedoensis var. nudiflora TaxID=2094558 RepID=A0A314ZK54_PRUYE|nr:uncharacterized protein Pyn_29889 [Prunus yedoensis var. nudiflora]